MIKLNIKDISIDIEGDNPKSELIVQFNDDKIDNLQISGDVVDFINLANDIQHKSGDVIKRRDNDAKD